MALPIAVPLDAKARFIAAARASIIINCSSGDVFMIKRTFAFLGLATLGLTTAAAAPPASNKTIVTDFYETAFVRHQPTVAAHKYLADRYVQHNPHVPNGPAPFIGFFEQYFRTHPTASSRIYRVIAEGNLVVVHSNAKENPQNAGLALIDIFRVERGKIVEHWDVQQPVVMKTANGNTMFDGDNAR